MSIVALMVATLDNQSDGLPTLEKSIITLINAKFDKALIDKHVEKVHAQQYAIVSRNGHFRPEFPARL